MKPCLVLCLFVTLTASSDLAVEEEWHQWKELHGKSYADEIEESMRRSVWSLAYHHIQEHNSASDHSYQLGLNRFADMVRIYVAILINPVLHVTHFSQTVNNTNILKTLLLFQTNEEFRKTYLTPGMEAILQNKDGHLSKAAHNVSAPTSLDWRTKGFVSEVCITPVT